MAQNGGFLDDWQKLMISVKGKIYSTRTGSEAAFGRDLATDQLVTNGSKALQVQQKSGTGQFHKIISAPPSRNAPAIASILQDAMYLGVRGGKEGGWN